MVKSTCFKMMFAHHSSSTSWLVPVLASNLLTKKIKLCQNKQEGPASHQNKKKVSAAGKGESGGERRQGSCIIMQPAKSLGRTQPLTKFGSRNNPGQTHMQHEAIFKFCLLSNPIGVSMIFCLDLQNCEHEGLWACCG